MINFIIYTIIAYCIYLLYLVVSHEDETMEIERESDAVIEVIAGKFMLKEK